MMQRRSRHGGYGRRVWVGGKAGHGCIATLGGISFTRNNEERREQYGAHESYEG